MTHTDTETHTHTRRQTRRLAAPTRIVATLAALLALATACSTDAPTTPGGGSGSTPVVVTRILLSTPQTTLRVGGTLQLAAYAVSAAGDTLRDRAITWRSDNPSIASVNSAGVVSAIAPGTVSVRAAAGDVEGVAVIAVSAPEAAAVQLDVAGLDLEEGVTRRVTAVVLDAAGTPIPGAAVAWSTADASIATVSADGAVTALRWGTTTLRASVAGKTATAAVRVLTRSTYDLLFDSRTGYSNEPELYTLDVRSPAATPARLNTAGAGTWDVSPSPDGTQVVFVAREPFGPQLFIARRDGSGARLITSESGGADQPVWSPDGTRIAFRAWSAGGPPGPFNPADIKVVQVGAIGTGATSIPTPTPLTANKGTQESAEWPTWSPRQADGHHRVAYSSQRLAGYQVGRIMSVRDDGTDRRPLTAASDYLESEPAWSPDGASVLFVRTGGTASGDIWLLDVASGTTRQFMSNDPASDQHAPAWSPDGALIAFTSKHEPGADGGYFYQLYTVAANGTGLTRRTPSGGDKSNPAWMLRQ